MAEVKSDLVESVEDSGSIDIQHDKSKAIKKKYELQNVNE